MMKAWLWIPFILLTFSCLADESGAPAKVMPVNVMTFNIRYGLANDGPDSWEYRKPLVLEVIRTDSPDIVGLQEALRFQLDTVCDAFPEYGRVGIGRDPGGNGEYSAILYRKSRFDVHESGTFWLSETPAEPSTHWGNKHLRICTWVRLLERNSGQFLYVYNTHYDHQSQHAREQSSILLAKQIAGRTYQDPLILMGDFNAGEDNPAILHLLNETALKLVDSFRMIHPEQSMVGTFNGFSGKTDGDKIDYVFVNEGFRVMDARINHTSESRRYPSDHFPVSARIVPVYADD